MSKTRMSVSAGTEFNVAAYLAEKRALVDRLLEAYLPPENARPQALSRAVRYSLFAGGKRIRPILALAATEAVGAKSEPGLSLAASLECIHTYSLIHDDLPALDNDDFRRGRPTCHKAFGEAVAILAGDALLTHAFALASDARLSPEIPSDVRIAVIAELGEAAGAAGMVGGQVEDVLSEGAAADHDQLVFIHTHKTGALIRASARIGGIIGAASRDALARISVYGERIGLAFQIADDILDVEGSRESLGKSPGKDRESRKMTFPSIVGLDRSKAMARECMDAALDALEPLGRAAEPLRAIGRFIVTRKQ